MSVRVTTSSGESVTFDNGDTWTVVGDRLDVIKNGNPNANPPTVDKTIGSFSTSHWASVRITAKEDKAALLATARDLINDVDDGNFGHQPLEWQKRAEQFLADTV